jgi:hypothetical protein
VAGANLVHWRGLTITWECVAQVGGLLVLLVLGAVLPYVTMEHFNARTELVQSTARLFGAAAVLNGIDPTYLPSYDVAVRSQMNLAFNVIGLAPGLQEIGTLVAAATCWGLFFDEINKFFWWPLHLSGYLLLVVPIPLFIGLQLLRANRVVVSAGPAWVPAVLAGLLILIVTFRARNRIDTYRGI